MDPSRSSPRHSRAPVIMLLVAAMVIALLTACAPAPTPPVPGAVVGFTDGIALRDHLADEGMRLSELGESKYAWFEVPAMTYEVGEDGRDALFVHAYGDASAARAAARRVSPDGKRVIDLQGTEVLVEWLGQPHLYQSGPLLVVYVGTDAGALRLLEEALGTPFAGASAVEIGS